MNTISLWKPVRWFRRFDHGMYYASVLSIHQAVGELPLMPGERRCSVGGFGPDGALSTASSDEDNWKRMWSLNLNPLQFHQETYPRGVQLSLQM